MKQEWRSETLLTPSGLKALWRELGWVDRSLMAAAALTFIGMVSPHERDPVAPPQVPATSVFTPTASWARDRGEACDRERRHAALAPMMERRSEMYMTQLRFYNPMGKARIELIGVPDNEHRLALHVGHVILEQRFHARCHAARNGWDDIERREQKTPPDFSTSTILAPLTNYPAKGACEMARFHQKERAVALSSRAKLLARTHAGADLPDEDVVLAALDAGHEYLAAQAGKHCGTMEPAR